MPLEIQISENAFINYTGTLIFILVWLLCMISIAIEAKLKDRDEDLLFEIYKNSKLHTEQLTYIIEKHTL